MLKQWATGSSSSAASKFQAAEDDNAVDE